MFSRYASLLLLLLSGLLLGTACQKESDPTPVSSLEQILRDNPEYSTLYAGLRKTNLLPALQQSKFLTVLAPTNAAFAELSGTPYTTATSIMALQDVGQIEQLRRVLQYHLLPEQALNEVAEVEHKQFTTLLPAAGAAGNQLYLWHFSGKIALNGLYTAWTDARGQHTVGGVVHALPHVLLPPARTLAEEVRQRAADGAEYGLFWEALQRPVAAPVLALLSDAQRDYTLLLPSNGGLLRTLRRMNPAWTSVAAVPDAALLRLLQLHCLPTRLPSYLLFKNDRNPTLAGSQWDYALDFHGGFDLFGLKPYDASCQVMPHTNRHRLSEQEHPHLVALDQTATNGIIHLLDDAVQP